MTLLAHRAIDAVERAVIRYQRSREPREGDTRINRAGHEEILRGGRWHLTATEQQESIQQPQKIAGFQGTRKTTQQDIETSTPVQEISEDELSDSQNDTLPPSDTGPEASIATEDDSQPENHSEHHEFAGDTLHHVGGTLGKLIEQLHEHEDTVNDGHIRVSTLKDSAGRKVLQELRDRQNSGDNFGTVYDVSEITGKPSLAYESPAGNLIVSPPNRPGGQWDVHYSVFPVPDEHIGDDDDDVDPWDTGGFETSEPNTDQEMQEPEAATDAANVSQTTSIPAPATNWDYWTQPQQKKTPLKNVLKTKLGQAAAEAVGTDDPQLFRLFVDRAKEVHQDVVKDTLEIKSAYENVLEHYAPNDPHRTDPVTGNPLPNPRKRLLGQLNQVEQRGSDTDSITGFDEIAETMAREYPHVLGKYMHSEQGSSEDDIEWATYLFLRDAERRKYPNVHDDEVIGTVYDELMSIGQRASEHERRMQHDPEYRRQWEEIESVPFAKKDLKQRYYKWRIQRYAKQTTLWTEEDERKHPRDASGKWTRAEKHDVSYETKKGEKRVRKEWRMPGGEALPPHLSNVKLPPAWTDVHISKDASSHVVARGKDAKGREQRVYSQQHIEQQAMAKFSRVKEGINKFEDMERENAANLSHDNPIVREAAAVQRLIMTTGIRPGSERDTGAEKQAYGATTLQARHVHVDDGGNVTLKFTGKKGVNLEIPITHQSTAQDLIARKSAVCDDCQIFEVNDSQLRQYTRTLDGGSFKTKDFRTIKGTMTAAEAVEHIAPPKNEKERKQKIKQVATIVSNVLGNTPTIALQSYIDPHVFESWKTKKESDERKRVA